MLRQRISRLAIVFSLLLLASSARAQTVSGGAIAGVVKDSSGAVIPGVTVEAASPALIEKIRTAVTDDRGVFTIIDLRPGEYTVTFTLSGFTTLRRDGIALTTGFTATVNAELAVGAMEETMTVSGAAPTVDIRNVSQQKVFDKAVVDALPLGKNSGVYVTLLPGGLPSQPRAAGCWR